MRRDREPLRAIAKQVRDLEDTRESLGQSVRDWHAMVDRMRPVVEAAVAYREACRDTMDSRSQRRRLASDDLCIAVDAHQSPPAAEPGRVCGACRWWRVGDGLQGCDNEAIAGFRVHDDEPCEHYMPDPKGDDQCSQNGKTNAPTAATTTVRRPMSHTTDTAAPTVSERAAPSVCQVVEAAPVQSAKKPGGDTPTPPAEPEPASPLPWWQDAAEIRCPADEVPDSEPGEMVVACLGPDDEGEQDAAYIVHACNAYPELVAETRTLMAGYNHKCSELVEALADRDRLAERVGELEDAICDKLWRASDDGSGDVARLKARLRGTCQILVECVGAPVYRCPDCGKVLDYESERGFRHWMCACGWDCDLPAGEPPVAQQPEPQPEAECVTMWRSIDPDTQRRVIGDCTMGCAQQCLEHLATPQPEAQPAAVPPEHMSRPVLVWMSRIDLERCQKKWPNTKDWKLAASTALVMAAVPECVRWLRGAWPHYRELTFKAIGETLPWQLWGSIEWLATEAPATADNGQDLAGCEPAAGEVSETVLRWRRKQADDIHQTIGFMRSSGYNVAADCLEHLATPASALVVADGGDVEVLRTWKGQPYRKGSMAEARHAALARATITAREPWVELRRECEIAVEDPGGYFWEDMRAALAALDELGEGA